jgi:hypothetical protein
MNGNIKSANVYYSDNDTYTGTPGAETNPFCVEDFWDMTNLNEYATFTGVHFRLVNTIDFDDYPEFFEGFINRKMPKKNSAGVISYVGSVNDAIYITSKSVVFDGYNNTFRNIVLYGTYHIDSVWEYGPSLFSFSTNDGNNIIKNLRVINLICSSNSGLFSVLGNAPSITFIGCDFGIYKLNNNSCWLNNICYSYSGVSSRRAVFERCTINFKGNTIIRPTLIQSYGNNHIYKYCHINLDVFNWQNSFITLSGATDAGLYQFTYVTGRIRDYNQEYFVSSNYSSYISQNKFLHNDKLNNFTMCYINLKIETSRELNYGRGIIIGSFATVPMTPLIINITKLSNNNTIPIYAGYNGGNAIKKLTDEQLKDTNYLLGLGFSVTEEVGG